MMISPRLLQLSRPLCPRSKNSSWAITTYTSLSLGPNLGYLQWIEAPPRTRLGYFALQAELGVSVAEVWQQ